MINLHKKFEEHQGRVGLLLQVHDELIVEADEDLVDLVKGLMVEEMETAIKLDVPLKVDVRVGNSWGDETNE